MRKFKNNCHCVKALYNFISIFRNENYNSKHKAFTLSETLITIVILGILAAILVPNLIKNQVENANRTKVKKTMAAYEKAINFMIVENDIKSTEALRELGQDNCQYTREYFKTVQDGSNNCIFKTADRVWWDITDITNPIISLKDEITDSNKASIRANALSYNADTTSFALVGRFDDIGTLRVNDNAYEQTYGTVTNQKYVAKLWYFITQSVSALSGFDKCNLEGAATCTITANGVSANYTKYTTDIDTNVNYTCAYFRESDTKNCNGNTSTAIAGDYWISDIFASPAETEAKSKETCDSSVYEECNNLGDYFEAARLKCEKAGGKLASLAELEIARQNNKLPAHSYFWAYEEQSTFGGETMHYNGYITGDSKYDDGAKVICIGNK